MWLYCCHFRYPPCSDTKHHAVFIGLSNLNSVAKHRSWNSGFQSLGLPELWLSNDTPNTFYLQLLRNFCLQNKRAILPGLTKQVWNTVLLLSHKSVPIEAGMCSHIHVWHVLLCRGPQEAGGEDIAIIWIQRQSKWGCSDLWATVSPGAQCLGHLSQEMVLQVQ